MQVTVLQCWTKINVMVSSEVRFSYNFCGHGGISAGLIFHATGSVMPFIVSFGCPFAVPERCQYLSLYNTTEEALLSFSQVLAF